jgi:hypothetical protein
MAIQQALYQSQGQFIRIFIRRLQYEPPLSFSFSIYGGNRSVSGAVWIAAFNSTHEVSPVVCIVCVFFLLPLAFDSGYKKIMKKDKLAKCRNLNYRHQQYQIKSKDSRGV